MILAYKNARQRRQNAIGMIAELYMPVTLRGKNFPDDMRQAPAAEIADNIRKLAQLGRTPRWQAGINRWATMVEAASDDPRDIRWAFLQGMVYAGHASE